MRYFGTRTVLGALLAVAAWLAAPQNLDVVNKVVSLVSEAAGIIVSVYGLRRAIARGGPP